MTVLPIAEHHAASFRQCLDTVAREKRYLAQLAAPPLERVQQFVHDSVVNDAAQFVAVDAAGHVVGWADVLPSWAHAAAHCGTLGMGVLPAYRGQGVGRQLLHACLAKAWSKGLTRIELEVRADNAPAIRLYERLGFAREALKKHAMRVDGVYHDAFQMSLLHPGAQGQQAAPPAAALPAIAGFTVRPITLDDAQAWASYVCLPQVMEHTSSTARSAADLLPMIQRMLAGSADAPIRFVLQPQGSTAIVATVGFHTVSSLNGTAEITYDVAPHCWGQGIATAACRAATLWGLQVRGWHRIQATTLLANLRSQRVLQRCGYLREGVVRNFRVVRGLPADYCMFSTVPGDTAHAG
ncbi:MAG TPA: GNAT family N-acetyltransferase [Burkholderiaceae bacterium]|nr:GNAT family N-acetyltransferase [Burkholderiaceae bacterium]